MNLSFQYSKNPMVKKIAVVLFLIFYFKSFAQVSFFYVSSVPLEYSRNVSDLNDRIQKYAFAQPSSKNEAQELLKTMISDYSESNFYSIQGDYYQKYFKDLPDKFSEEITRHKINDDRFNDQIEEFSEVMKEQFSTYQLKNWQEKAWRENVESLLKKTKKSAKEFIKKAEKMTGDANQDLMGECAILFIEYTSYSWRLYKSKKSLEEFSDKEYKDEFAELWKLEEAIKPYESKIFGDVK